MKKGLRLLLCALLLSLVFGFSAYARAGGGGSGGGGGGSSGGGSSRHMYSDTGTRRSNPISSILNTGIGIAIAAGGTIVFVYRARKAKAKSVRLMKAYEKVGKNWNYREIQKRIEEAYYEIQECWRRQDADYAAEYLSRELKEQWQAKLEWMVIRGEEVVQKNVKLLSAVPVQAVDQEGESDDRIWYLIHGSMIGYYVDRQTKEVLRGNTRPERFYEYWLFIYEEGRWVLHEIRQKNEMDIRQFSE